jgi:hypothetical protein
MSVVAAGLSTSYSPVQDRALSPVGGDLRASMQRAINNPETDNRTSTILQRVASALKNGRDEEAVLVSLDAYTHMFEFLTLLPRHVPIPEIVVESEHQIGLDWEREHQQLALTINETTYIGFSALLGYEPVYGRTPFAGSVPETIAFLLQRLFPCPSGVSEHI